jgi:hypothetical protein
MTININYVVISLCILISLIIIYLVYIRIKCGDCNSIDSYRRIDDGTFCHENGDIISSFNKTLPYYPDKTAKCCPGLEELNINIMSTDPNQMTRMCRPFLTNKNDYSNCGLAGENLEGNKKTCCDGGVAIDKKCSQCSGIIGQCDMGNNWNNKKIIVIRHGHDKDFVDEGYGDNKFKAYLPGNKKKEFELQWLSNLGCREAAAYAVALPKFIKDYKYAPIVKVFTQDPDVKEETSNPFRTIYNFIINCNIQDVVFTIPIKDEEKQTIVSSPDDIIYNTDDASGSIIMCYTSQAISGMDKSSTPEDGSIFRHIMNSMNIKENFEGPPCKGSTVYVFGKDDIDRSKGTVELFHLDVNSNEIRPHRIACVKEPKPVLF